MGPRTAVGDSGATLNANRARPLAAYALVSLACALVLAEGMRSDVGASLGAASDGPGARPASASTATTVPGTVLRGRSTTIASATPTQLPRLDVPGAASATGATSASSGTGSPGSSAGGGGVPDVNLHPATRPDPGTAAGKASPNAPSADPAEPGTNQGTNKGTNQGTNKGKNKSKATGKKDGKAQGPQQNGHGKKPKGRGPGKVGAHAISLRWF